MTCSAIVIHYYVENRPKIDRLLWWSSGDGAVVSRVQLVLQTIFFLFFLFILEIVSIVLSDKRNSENQSYFVQI